VTQVHVLVMLPTCRLLEIYVQTIRLECFSGRSPSSE
jgi:hypothetical protein